MPPDPLRPPRPELLALLDSVKDDPDDDTPRLVLADWLEEHGDRFDGERARFIRADVARARNPSGARVSDQVRRDTANLQERWLKPLSGFFSEAVLARGLPNLTASLQRMLQPDVPAILAGEAFAFVQTVKLRYAYGPHHDGLRFRIHLPSIEPRPGFTCQIGEVAAVPEFRHVPGLVVDPSCAHSARCAVELLDSPNLTGLRQLDLHGVSSGIVGTKALAKNPALSGLRKLSLTRNKLVDKAAAALAGSPHLTKLQVLSLADNNIGDKGAEALTASATLAGLRELDLRDNPRLTPGGKQLLRDAFADRVKLN